MQGANLTRPYYTRQDREREGAKMELEQLKPYLQDYANSVTQKSKGGLYLCPICGSGTGAHKTGAFSIKGEQWKCFSCNQGGDIFDLYAAINKCDLSEATRAIMARYGNNSKPIKRANKTSTKPVQNQPETAEQPHDYAAELAAYHAALAGSPGETYLQGRGLTVDTMNRFNLGYNAAKKTITIPYNTAGTYYGQRSIDPNARPHDNLKNVTMPLFNAAALYSASACFIVESPLCAISITQEGGQAVAISGIGGKNRLIEQLKKKPTKAALVLSLDNDEPGQKAAEEIAAELTALGVFFLQANIAGEHKDPNDRLQHDKAGLQAAIAETAAKAVKAQGNAKPEPADPRPDAVSKYIEGLFLDDIHRFVAFKDRKTGFVNLDEHSRGLYPGMYAIGGATSLGKTTFVHQLCDQLAEQGEHILFFSLEQSKLEMVTKSISRLTAKADINKAVSAIDIRGGNITEAVIDAAEAYHKTGERISVIACNFSVKIGDITKTIRDYIQANNARPIVVIDYLQVIPPDDTRQGETEKVNEHVRAIKTLQSELDLVVFVVSSLNRASYVTPINYESLKQSGGIEYTADVVWGLQLQEVRQNAMFEGDKDKIKKIDTIRKAKKETPRKIELVCIKNRYGKSDYACGFLYDPRFDLFMVDNAYTDPDEEETSTLPERINRRNK